MPTNDTPESPLGATPQLRESPFTGRHCYEVDLYGYLDNPAPTERVRAQGRSVTVVGPMDAENPGWPVSHTLAPTSFGPTGKWGEVMVALGTASRVGWLYGHHPGEKPFVTNGHALLWAPADVVAAVAAVEANTELPLNSFEQWRQAIDGESWGAPVPLDSVATTTDHSNVVMLGVAGVAMRLVAAALYLGGRTARPSHRLGPVMVDDVGVLMPLQLSEAGPS